ncbi:MAG: LysR family transcriptional regulator, partial [Gluconacetobacter diazotrophicus]|nr:LysR family transcriptional regulator [Gluconacetobacter diazotrophicus]
MTDPDWHLWRAFLAVSRGGSLSAAARQLRLTQPTLGRQIAALEQALGTPLFTRSTDGLRPTDRAAALLPHAEAMAAAAASLSRAAAGPDDAERGIVRLAASEAMGGAVLPRLLLGFRAAHPGIAIELSLSDRTEDLLRRDADLAVRNTPPTQNALLSRRVGEVSVRLFAREDYVRRHGLPATARDLAHHTLI